MPVELVAEEEFETETPRLRLVRPEDEPTYAEQAYAMAPRLPEPKRQIDEQVLQVMGVLAQVLAVRIMLLLSVIGTFALAWRAMSAPTPMALMVVLLLAVSTVGPLAWLTGRACRRRPLLALRTGRTRPDRHRARHAGPPRRRSVRLDPQ